MNDFFEYDKTICFLRLRSSERYLRPLETIADCMFHVCQSFVHRNPQHDYRFVNCSFTPSKPTKKIQDIIDSDYIVIPTEQEFTFHIKFRALGFVKRRTDEFLEEIRKVVKGKKIILLQWDRADSVELYKTKVFPDNDVDIVSIDENDYIGGLHALRYHFLKDNLKIRCDKDLDFSYWGTSKKKKVGEDESGEISGDVRHEVFKEIHKSDLSSCFIGTFDGFARDVKFSKDMRKVAPYIARSKTTLCLNWPGYDEHLTARYNEAMAYDVIPLVWKNYDCNNRLVAIDWQRCYSFEDIQKKCLELRDESVRLEKLSIVKDKHKKSIRNIKYYEEEFDKFLNEAIK